MVPPTTLASLRFLNPALLPAVWALIARAHRGTERVLRRTQGNWGAEGDLVGPMGIIRAS